MVFEVSKKQEFPLTNWIFLYAVMFAVPVILIFAYYMHAETLLQYSGFDLYITSWIHHKFCFLTGNVLGWFLSFLCLSLMAVTADKIKRTVLFAIIGFPLFSSVIEIAIYGGVIAGSWGFSGILYSIYGVIVFMTIAGLLYYLKNKVPSANPMKSSLIMIAVILLALSPVVFTPSVVDLHNGYFLYISTLRHQLGMIWGLLVCIVFYRGKKELEVKYWPFGLILIIIQVVSTAELWL